MAEPQLGLGAPPAIDSEFLEALLHDLYGPVSRCRMLGELLARRTADLGDDARSLVGHIGSSVSAAEGVLNAVRRYADAVALSFHPKAFRLDIAVDTACARLRSQLSESGAQIVRGELPVVYGDAAQVGLLFEELFSNALRFRSERKPEIAITARLAETGRHWIVSVADNGAGIDPDRALRPLSKTPGRPGPGIGLTICRHIARLHGGEIQAVRGEQGSEMILTLPDPGPPFEAALPGM